MSTDMESGKPRSGSDAATRTVERIAEPWGTRTPYGPSKEWPVRIDTFLEDGISKADVDAWVQSASILHSNGDAIDIAVKDGRIVGVRGHVPSQVNHGRLDPKGLFGWQANGSASRLTRPLVRRNGQLVEASWDEAMDLIVERSKSLLRESGPSSMPSTPRASSSWRTTTRWRSSPGRASERTTLTATRACARRRRRKR